MKLSARLGAVAQHVLPGEPVADVGTDHGQLPVSLLLSGRVPRVIASDRRPDPLNNARRLAAASRLEAPRFEARLSDGLAHLQAGEAATVTICGMGGALMVRILTAHPPQRCGVRRLVLQPNNAAERLRPHLVEDGWAIVDEEMVAEGGYFYPIIVAERVDRSVPLSASDALLGPVLRERQPAAYRAWLAAEAARLEALIARAVGSGAREDSPALAKLRERLAIISPA